MLAVLTLLLAARLDLLQRLGLTLLLCGLGQLTVGICLAGHPVTDRPSVQKRRLRRLSQCAILLSRKSPVTLRYGASYFSDVNRKTAIPLSRSASRASAMLSSEQTAAQRFSPPKSRLAGFHPKAFLRPLPRLLNERLLTADRFPKAAGPLSTRLRWPVSPTQIQRKNPRLARELSASLLMQLEL
ncbi:hypothetical protein IFT54_04135 [Sphingomonas sp. CFBP 13714]|uniref:hypothetical protein n=1 Tax=Sphingomonas sp. CFBP 13714 TaxID=2775308 RepID=UPI00177ABD5D|nr:hypothetical protein [Sphingomonas sp. CFBP 13714]MBD8699001.1 hypothetical protein [Sphingomonas sp. CFBP 13714]